MRDIDCFWYIDGGDDDDDAPIRALCLACHDTRYPHLGWPYQGACGEWEVRCGKCDRVIDDRPPGPPPPAGRPPGRRSADGPAG